MPASVAEFSEHRLLGLWVSADASFKRFRINHRSQGPGRHPNWAGAWALAVVGASEPCGHPVVRAVDAVTARVTSALT